MLVAAACERPSEGGQREGMASGDGRAGPTGAHRCIEGECTYKAMPTARIAHRMARQRPDWTGLLDKTDCAARCSRTARRALGGGGGEPGCREP